MRSICQMFINALYVSKYDKKYITKTTFVANDSERN